MAEETVVEQAADAPEAVETETLVSEAGKPTPEEQAATDAENKRLLEADDKSLKPEELAKKQELVKQADAAKSTEVPEKYDIKLPEGMAIDEKAMEALTPVFKDMKLTQAQVQKLAETYAPVMRAQQEAQQQEAIAMWNKQGEDWKAESLKMFGPSFKQDMAFVAKVRDRFGKDAVDEKGQPIKDAKGNKVNDLALLMEETKIGNNPVLLRVLRDIGKVLGEDKFVEGTPSVQDSTKPFYNHPDSLATLK